MACAADPEPPPVATAAAPPDRPLDSYLGDPTAVRAAVLIEVALAQVRPGDLGHCLDEFGRQGAEQVSAARAWRLADRGLGPAGRWRCLRPPPGGRHPSSTRSPTTAGRTGSSIARCCASTMRADGAVACLSCVFDYEGAESPIVTPTRWTPAAGRCRPSAISPPSCRWVSARRRSVFEAHRVLVAQRLAIADLDQLQPLAGRDCSADVGCRAGR